MDDELVSELERVAGLSAEEAKKRFPADLDYMIALASESHVDRSLADPVPFAMNNTATNGKTFLENFYLKSKRSVEKAAQEGPAAWVIPSDDPRPVECAGPWHGPSLRPRL